MSFSIAATRDSTQPLLASTSTIVVWICVASDPVDAYDFGSMASSANASSFAAVPVLIVSWEVAP